MIPMRGAGRDYQRAEEAVRDMGDVPKLTKAQARVLGSLAASVGGMSFRDEYGQSSMNVLIRRGLVDAPIGSFGRVHITDLGRAALSKHRGPPMGDMTPEQRADELCASLNIPLASGMDGHAAIATAIRDAEERGRLAAAELFDRIGVISETPTGKVSEADKELYRAMSTHFEPIGRSVLPNWKAMAAAIRAAGERESDHG